jgi:hypothetical protein
VAAGKDARPVGRVAQRGEKAFALLQTTPINLLF